jgi:hypothetical protein
MAVCGRSSTGCRPSHRALSRRHHRRRRSSRPGSWRRAPCSSPSAGSSRGSRLPRRPTCCRRPWASRVPPSRSTPADVGGGVSNRNQIITEPNDSEFKFNTVDYISTRRNGGHRRCTVLLYYTVGSPALVLRWRAGYSRRASVVIHKYVGLDHGGGVRHTGFEATTCDKHYVCNIKLRTRPPPAACPLQAYACMLLPPPPPLLPPLLLLRRPLQCSAEYINPCHWQL